MLGIMPPASLYGAETPSRAAADGGRSRVDITRHQRELRLKQICRELTGVIRDTQPTLPGPISADPRDGSESGQSVLAATMGGHCFSGFSNLRCRRLR
jgi:hypothetical protein